MIIYYETETGKIIGGCYAKSPDVLITSVPSGCVAAYYDDETFPELETNMGMYQIDVSTLLPVDRVFTPEELNPPPEPPSLQQQISDIQDILNIILMGGM